ncbi:MAG: phosphoribosylformylglycinamidine synthase subunit PurL, partial [Myxococcota bacterium]
DGNILVNVFTVGYAKRDEIFKGVAAGVGNPIFYVGAGTGRDGIHGATKASDSLGEGSEEKRPTVQVGDPFREKLLIEACLELMKTGAIVGIQDMGAAGLTSSSVEMADRGGNGVRIDVDKIPAREEGMVAYEFLLSESQERMLVVLERGREDEVARVFEKWELEWAEIGEVVTGDRFEILEGGEKVVDLPVALLTSSAPAYDRPRARPAYLDALTQGEIAPPEDLGKELCELLGSPNICSRRVVFEQFDHMVGAGTVVRPGDGDAAVLRIPGTTRALAIAADCNSRFCYLDPRQGAALAVAECARNISCVGATPLGTTDCMNFGDPTNPEIMWQFSEAIDGMGEACEALGAPVVGGNVSLYNATDGRDIFPTPTVALVGGFSDGIAAAEGYVGMALQDEGDHVVVLGATDVGDIGGSAYLWHKTQTYGLRPPKLDLALEVSVQRVVREAIARGLVKSAHDCADGGLGVALAESCIKAKEQGRLLGLELSVGARDRADLWLFSESPSRIVVSLAAGDMAALEELTTEHGVPFEAIGRVTGSARITWGDVLDVALGEAAEYYANGLESLG